MSAYIEFQSIESGTFENAEKNELTLKRENSQALLFTCISSSVHFLNCQLRKFFMNDGPFVELLHLSFDVEWRIEVTVDFPLHACFFSASFVTYVLTQLLSGTPKRFNTNKECIGTYLGSDAVKNH